MLKIGWKPVVIKMKGPTQQEKDLAAKQADFVSTLQQSYGTMFAGQNHILEALNAQFQPILAAGSSQKGMSAEEETSRRTSMSDTQARAFSAEKRALNEQLAARGGGNAFLPSGATAQLQSGLDIAEAESESAGQNAITQENYALGRQQFNTAAGVLGSAASIYNPTGFAGQATGAGTAAFDSAAKIQQQQQQSGFWSTAGGILGGVAGLAGDVLSAPSGSAGAKLTSKIFG